MNYEIAAKLAQKSRDVGAIDHTITSSFWYSRFKCFERGMYRDLVGAETRASHGRVRDTGHGHGHVPSCVKTLVGRVIHTGLQHGHVKRSHGRVALPHGHMPLVTLKFFKVFKSVWFIPELFLKRVLGLSSNASYPVSAWDTSKGFYISWYQSCGLVDSQTNVASVQV
ncbi:hypothetical protein F383_25314 [Gossypium arboreum]|uniref:Uncharacterized protein n=1 Tax=Gossypium arboreum TaxID=29729 RepID=A0A0B0P1U2_GOSAR|nr:hypothetical protein F383_25314 [Gossypium arboreum]